MCGPGWPGEGSILNAKTTASFAASPATSWTAANARDQVQVTGSPMPLPCARIIDGNLIADRHAAPHFQSGFSSPDRGTRRRVEAKLCGRNFDAIDAARGQGKTESRPFPSRRTRGTRRDRKDVRHPRAHPDGKLRRWSYWTGTWK